MTTMGFSYEILLSSFFHTAAGLGTVLLHSLCVSVCICLCHAVTRTCSLTNIMIHTFILTWRPFCTVTNIISSCNLKPDSENVMRSHRPACLHLNPNDSQVHILLPFPSPSHRLLASLACILQMNCIKTANYNHIQSRTASLSGCDDWITMWAKSNLCECIVT